jgi:hypothetical protein
MELEHEPPTTQRLPRVPLGFANKTLHSAHRMYLCILYDLGKEKVMIRLVKCFKLLSVLKTEIAD